MPSLLRTDTLIKKVCVSVRCSAQFMQWMPHLCERVWATSLTPATKACTCCSALPYNCEKLINVN